MAVDLSFRLVVGRKVKWLMRWVGKTMAMVALFDLCVGCASSRCYCGQHNMWTKPVDIAIYLVDPASSHMLVLKAKPCMCQYKQLDCEAAAGSLYQCSLM